MTTTVVAYRSGRIRVRRFNVEVQAAAAIGRAVYFPLRPLVRALEMSRQMQIKKVKAEAQRP